MNQVYNGRHVPVTTRFRVKADESTLTSADPPMSADVLALWTLDVAATHQI